MKLRIGIDVDDVVNDLNECMLPLFNSRTDKNYTSDIFTEYNIYSCVPKAEADVMMDIYNSSEIWNCLSPNKDAQQTIDKLIAMGHEVYFVSSCAAHTWGWKSEWLSKTYPSVPASNHICIEYKYLLNIDVLIDDNPAKLKQGIYTRVLFAQPWNCNTPFSQYDYRINKFSEVLDIIKGMGEEALQ